MTKTFKAWNGDRELTREQYIQEWLDATIQFGALFDGKDMQEFNKFFELRNAIEQQAGNKWDKQ
jgi:hypothetical protein